MLLGSHQDGYLSVLNGFVCLIICLSATYAKMYNGVVVYHLQLDKQWLLKRWSTRYVIKYVYSTFHVFDIETRNI